MRCLSHAEGGQREGGKIAMADDGMHIASMTLQEQKRKDLVIKFL